MRAGNFSQRRHLGTSNQNHARALRVCQGIDRFFVSRALLFKASQGAETRSVSFAFLQKAAPCSRQLQQPDCVAGGSGVKNDVVVLGRQCIVGQQCREFVEGSDFGGTGTGKLFLDTFDYCLRQNATHWAHDAVAVCLRRSLRINFHCRQTGNVRNGGDLVTNSDAEYLAYVGRWIGADQQHAPSGLGKLNSRSAGNRSLAHAAFAGEEEKARRLLKEFHNLSFLSSAAFTAGAAATGGPCFGGNRQNACPTCQLGAVRITARQGDFAVNENEWQALPRLSVPETPSRPHSQRRPSAVAPD